MILINNNIIEIIAQTTIIMFFDKLLLNGAQLCGISFAMNEQRLARIEIRKVNVLTYGYLLLPLPPGRRRQILSFILR